jgi:uncharacterized protein (TIGR02421 family)
MIEDYHKIDKELYFFFKKIFAYPRPLNVEIEKIKILKNRQYDPQLKYEKHPTNLSQIKNKLKELKIPKRGFGDILDKKREEMINHCNLIDNVGNKSFTDYSLNLYGKPSKELVKKAYKLMDLEINNFDNTEYNTLASIKKLLDSLLSHGFKWQVKAIDMVVGARFNLSKRVLYVNKNRLFSDNDLKRLIVHEVGTHIARAENGKKQRYLLFSYGFPNYLETEEGLAVYNEKINKLLSNSNLKHYAGRVIATNLALENSFSIVYNELLQYFDKDMAWNLALRAKRGLADTSKKGGFTKDHLYLKGKYIVEDFIENGGNVKDLYVGKIGIEHVALMKDIL